MTDSASTVFDPHALDFTRTVLTNGLVVIAHEDRGVPTVSLTVCYRVGSKDEGPGQTGSAHLFEHLMFTGSANLAGNYGERLTAAGAMQVNAYTTPDHTCFFETMPIGALDFALYAEADRMGSFRDALRQDALSQQQAIVIEEKAQREGAPLGRLGEVLTRGLFPPGHPYRHTVIGSVEDVTGMTLAAAREWHRRFYGPDNAVVVIAGPIAPDDAIARVQAQFGHIAPTGATSEMLSWVPALPLRRRDRLDMPGEHGGFLYLAWPIPEATDPDLGRLELVAALIGGSDIAPLHRALVRPGHALAVSAGVTAGALCSQFVLSIVLDVGADPQLVEADARRTLATVFAGAPDKEAIDRFRAARRASRALSLGDLGAKVSLMIEGEMLCRKPARFRDEMAELDAASPEEILGCGKRWLDNEPFVVDVRPVTPAPKPPALAQRPPQPAVAAQTDEAIAPKFDQSLLPTGLTHIRAPRDGARDFLIKLEFARGTASEAAQERGMSMLIAGMPYHGIGDRDPEALRRFTEEAGIQLVMGSTASNFSIQMSGPAGAAPAAAAMLADMVLRPRFDSDILEERKRDQIRAIRAATSDPLATANRLPALLLYGRDTPETRLSEGEIASVEGAGLVTLRDFHRRLFDPAGATLVTIAAAPILDEMDAAMADLISRWCPVADPLPPPAKIRLPHIEEEEIIFVEAGPADQMLVTMSLLLPAADNAREEAAARALANVLQRRLGTRLREELGWTYGIGAHVIDAELRTLPPRLSVQGALSDGYAVEAIAEIRAALWRLSEQSLPTEAELSEYRAQARSGLTGSIVQSGGIAAAIAVAARSRNPIAFEERLRVLGTLDAETVAGVLRRALADGPAVWVVASASPRVAEALADAPMPVRSAGPLAR